MRDVSILEAMERDMSHPGSDEVLANLGWVRRLALAIVRDAGAADDITQDVARVALERRDPVSSNGLRAWLGAVTRKLALDRTRSEAARRKRQHAVSRPEGDESDAEIVERGARQQRVAHAVMALSEPYRSTILYRYLDELPMPEVARRTNVNEVTARKRLSRGLEMLRTRLDAEFGTSTHGWAIALIPPTKGVAVMSTKWFAAAGAAALLGIGWLGWRAMQTPEPSSSPNTVAARTPLEAPPVDKGEDGKPAAPLTSPSTPVLARSSAITLVADPDATILHVRVLDRVSTAATEGRIECWWATTANAVSAVTRKFVDVQIHSETTDLVLPASAAEAYLRAAVHGHLGTTELTVKELRKGVTGRVERDVLLKLDEPLGSPSIQGVVTVDGRARIPHALTIRQTKQRTSTGWARVNAVDATYAVANALDGAELWITSDETIPLHVDLTEAVIASGALDLALSSGTTLQLTLLDRDDGHPLPHEDFLVTTSVRTSPSVSDSETRNHTTDEQGRCEVRGLVPDRWVSISPALEPPRRPMIFSDDWDEVHLHTFRPTEDMPIPPQPWWGQQVPDDNATIEITLQVKRAQTGAVIFGTVPKEMLAGQADIPTRIRVAADEVDAQGAKNGYMFDVPIDAEGRWSFPTHWPSKYVVWMEAVRPRAPRSEEVHVDVTSAGRTGPIQLERLEVHPNFELQITNVPSASMLSVSVFGSGVKPHSEDIDCKGTSCTHQLRVDGSCSLVVTWRPSGDFGTEVRRLFKVDPTRASSLQVDMGGDHLRTVELKVKGASIPASTMLGFGKLDQGSSACHESTSTSVLDGKVQSKLSLTPGRWFFECFDAQRDFNVTGVIEVGAGSEAVSISRDVVTVERAQIPHGIELTDVDGVILDGFGQPIRYPSTTAKGTMILNATARYIALP